MSNVCIGTAVFELHSYGTLDERLGVARGLYKLAHVLSRDPHVCAFN